MHCLVDGRRRKDGEMLQMLRRLEGDLLQISYWFARYFCGKPIDREEAVDGRSDIDSTYEMRLEVYSQRSNWAAQRN